MVVLSIIINRSCGSCCFFTRKIDNARHDICGNFAQSISKCNTNTFINTFEQHVILFLALYCPLLSEYMKAFNTTRVHTSILPNSGKMWYFLRSLFRRYALCCVLWWSGTDRVHLASVGLPQRQWSHLWPLLLTWFNFNPSMDMQSYAG